MPNPNISANTRRTISLSQAIQWTTHCRNNSTSEVKSHFWGEVVIDAFLNQSECIVPCSNYRLSI